MQIYTYTNNTHNEYELHLGEFQAVLLYGKDISVKRK